MNTKYRLPDGRVLRVVSGLGGAWFTTDAEEGARHRFKSRHLPPRATQAEAQADLDKWATGGKLQRAE